MSACTQALRPLLTALLTKVNDLWYERVAICIRREQVYGCVPPGTALRADWLRRVDRLPTSNNSARCAALSQGVCTWCICAAFIPLGYAICALQPGGCTPSAQASACSGGEEVTCVPRGWHSHCSRLPSISPLAFYLGGPSVPPAAPAGAHCYQPRRSRCLAAPASQQSVCRSPPCAPASPVVLLCAAPVVCSSSHYSYRSSVHFAKTTSGAQFYQGLPIKNPVHPL